MVTRTAPKGWHSRGYLPHFDSPEVPQHVVFRTAGALPKEISAALVGNESDAISAFDAWLDGGAGDGPLFEPKRAEIVADSLRFFDNSRYRLHAWCVMPNHVHVVVTMLAGFRLGDSVRSWKAFSAAKINRRTDSPGLFGRETISIAICATRPISPKPSAMSNVILSSPGSLKHRRNGVGLRRIGGASDREPSGSLFQVRA